MQKSRLCPLLAILIILLLLPAAAFGEEMRGYVKGEGYQYVNLGEYPFEKDGTVRPVLWRILSVEDGNALLLTEYVIDTSQVIFDDNINNIKGVTHEYRWIDTYEESDLYQYLNTEMIEKLFGSDPVTNAFIEEPGGGRLFILTTEQYTNTDYGFPKSVYGTYLPERQAEGTPWAIATRNLYKNHENGKVTYWVATLKNGSNDYKMQLVGYDGHLSYGALTRVNVGLRLNVRLDLNQVRISGGTGTKKDPFTLTWTGSVPTETPEPEIPAAAAENSPEPKTESEAVEEPVPNASPEPAPPADPEPKSAADNTALLSFVGDCSIGDGYNSIKSTNSYHSVVDREGYAWPFSLVKEYLASDDLTIANLEAVLTEQNQHKDIMFPLRAAPDHVNILLEGSIEVVNTVNNHCMDYFRQGYVDSLAVLDEAGIARFGSVSYGMVNGFDDLLVRDVNGIRFGFVGMTYPQSGDTKNLIKRIQKLKEEEGCDIVIVSLHWGRETHMTQTGGQVTMAKQLIDGGADVIYGHHPHVLQPMLFYQGKPIMFSTGNFTFGTMSKVDPHTGIFRFTYQKAEDRVFLSEIEVIPCQTSGSGDYRPFVLTDEAEIRKTFQILTVKNVPAKCENPPEYFLETGRIMFDENGMIIPEM